MMELKSYPVNECVNCGEKAWLYLCEQGHGTIACKDCLMAVKRRGEVGCEFKIKCNKKGDCNFVPLGRKDE